MSIKNVLLTGLAVAAFSSFAMAQQGGQPGQAPKEGMKRSGGMQRGGRGGFGGGERRGPGMMGGGMSFEKLNLTDAQKQRIQAIQESASTTREANKTQFEEFGKLLRLKREGLLTTDQGTRLNALQVQMQAKMRTDMEKMHNDILAVLTPDQKTLLEQGRGGMGGGRGEGRGPGGRGGQGGPGGPGRGAQAPPEGADAPPSSTVN